MDNMIEVTRNNSPLVISQPFNVWDVGSNLDIPIKSFFLVVKAYHAEPILESESFVCYNKIRLHSRPGKGATQYLSRENRQGKHRKRKVEGTEKKYGPPV